MPTTLATLRAIAALELRLAAGVRRDLRLGILPRTAALSAIRDHLRHARALIVAALILRPLHRAA